MIVVHATKDSMNPTPPPKRVDLPEVILPDPPIPNSDGEQTPPWWKGYQAWEEGERGRSQGYSRS